MKYLLTEEELKALTDGATPGEESEKDKEIKRLKKQLNFLLNPKRAAIQGNNHFDPLNQRQYLILEYDWNEVDESMKIVFKKIIKGRV